MGRRRLAWVAAVVFLGSACGSNPAAGPSSTPSPSGGITREEAWAQDIAFLMERMESLHPDLYHGVSSADLHQAADSLVADVTTIRDDQILVGLMRLVALVSSNGRDGHMGCGRPTTRMMCIDTPSGCGSFPTACT